MLDDAGRLDHRPAIVEQQREQRERRVPLEHLEILGVVLLEQSIFEWRLVGPKGDQDFLRVRRKGMPKEFEAHQAPSLIFSRNFSSSSLGSFVAKLPVSTSPSGS